MLVNQYRSRRQWHMLPTTGDASVVWWRITEDKNQEQLKRAPVFVEIFIDEGPRTRAEQEKVFTASLKNYGAVVGRKEYTIEQLNKKL